MLLEDMVGKNTGGSPKVEDLASISEAPGDVSGKFDCCWLLEFPLTCTCSPGEGE